MKNLFFILFFILFFLPAQITFGQDPPPSYEPTFISQWTYDIDAHDAISNICQAPNGFVISGGFGDSTYLYKALVMKMDNQGEVDWTWTGPDNSGATDIATLPDNTYIVTMFYGEVGNEVGTIAKFSSDGELLWEKDAGLNSAGPLNIDAANQHFAVATAQNDNRVKIFDFNGNVVDSILLPQKYYLKSSITLRNDLFLISGIWYDTVGVFNNDGYVALYKKQGNNWSLQWEDNVIDAVRTKSLFDADLNIYAAGYSLFSYTFITRRYDLTGQIVWEKEWDWDVEFSVVTAITLLPQNSSGVSGVVVGSASQFPGNDNSFGTVFAYDTAGNPLFSIVQSQDHTDLAGIKFNADNTLALAGILFAPDYQESDIYIELWSIDGITAVEPIPETMPLEYTLYQNYPNPFNPSTNIKFTLPQQEDVIITVFTSLGQEVETLVNESLPAGTYTVQFDGQGLASGVYFYQIRAGTFKQTKKMILVK